MSRTAKNAAAEQPESAPGRFVDLAARIVSSYMQGNRMPVGEVPGLIGAVHTALAQMASGGYAADAEHKPAVTVKKSIGDDFIICLEDGKKLTMLKRYLRTQFKMSPEEYRKKWDLPHDYPMVAPAYARLRSAFAKKIGLGRIPTEGRGRRKGKAA